MTTSTLVTRWEAAIESCIAEDIAELARRRPGLPPALLADLNATLLQIARQLLPGMSLPGELTAGGAAVLHEMLDAARERPLSARGRAAADAVPQGAVMAAAAACRASGPEARW